jgi:hypothetical protein
VLCCLAAGCGYTQGSLIAENNRRVALPIFGNKTFYRGLEFQLTDAVAQEIELRPGVQVVREQDADVVMKGTITNVQQRVLSETKTDQVRESSATITVEVDLVEPRTGHVRKHFVVVDATAFAQARGETLITAEAQSFLEIARKIVWHLEEPF